LEAVVIIKPPRPQRLREILCCISLMALLFQ